MATELKVVNGELGKVDNVVELANSVAQVILQKNLSMDMRGKRYVYVEGWQLIGGFFGVVPIVKALTDMSTDDTIKYRAEVELYDVRNDKVVGYGMAVCTNKEQGKSAFQDFAVASMAQTRATGKAYRLTFGWVMKLAGYEGTPAEEMEDGGTATTPKSEAPAEDKAAAFAEAKRRTQGVQHG